MNLPPLALRRSPDFGALVLLAGALVLAAFAGLVTAWLPWQYTLLILLLPTVLLASLALPQLGLAVTVMFLFEVVPSVLQPRLPFGGGRLQAADIMMLYLCAVVLAQTLWRRGQPMQAMGPIRWPLVYLLACLAVSLVYVRYFAPNTLSLGEARVMIGWLLVPITVLAVDTPARFRWMVRGVVLVGVVIALYVSIQSLTGVRIMTGSRVELLDQELNGDVVRSIAGGGVYIVCFALFLVINRMIERRFAWWWVLPVAVLLVFGLAVQFGRGVWLSAAVGLLVSAALFRGVGGLLRVVAIGVFTTGLMLSAASVFKPRLAEAVVERAMGIRQELEGGGSYFWRRAENQAALARIQRNPILGVGLGGQYKQTASSEGHFGIEGTYIHNGYLFFPLKMGLFASFVPLAFMLAFALTLRQGVARHKAQAGDPAFVAALAGAFIVPCISSYTQPEWADPRGVAAFAIFCGLALLYRRFGAAPGAAAASTVAQEPGRIVR